MSRRTRIRPALFLIAALLWMACQAEEMSSGSISAETFLAAPPADALVLDVRSREEYQGGHVPGAINVPHGELSSRITELAGGPARTVVVYCERGGRAEMAAEVLSGAGYSQVLHLEGDMSDWRAKGRPLESVESD